MALGGLSRSQRNLRPRSAMRYMTDVGAAQV